MIQSRIKTYNVENRISGTDDYGQLLDTFENIGSVEVSVSLITKVANELDPRYFKSTHIGLTYDKTLVEGMKLIGSDNSYMIKIVNNDGRMAQLTLEVI